MKSYIEAIKQNIHTLYINKYVYTILFDEPRHYCSFKMYISQMKTLLSSNIFYLS